MNFIDLHCDTLSKVLGDSRPGILEQNDKAVDFTGMRQSGCMLQVFASFLNLGCYPEAEKEELAWQDALAMNDLFAREAARSGDISIVTSADTLAKARQDGNCCALLSVEEGGILNNRPERLDTLYERGIRLITLTWNYENCLGFPNSTDSRMMTRGLKPFGREIVRSMEEKGMLVDVSHLSDVGFYDVAELIQGPFLASHSNSRQLCPHPRNLTDPMLRILGDHGGVAGLNFCPRFLQPDQDFSRIDDMVRHIRHMVNTAGLEAVALGSDLDGITGALEIGSIRQIHLLEQALRKSGFSEDALEKIFWKNAYRLLGQTLKPSSDTARNDPLL